MTKKSNIDGHRYYTIGDANYPSVTSILQIISKPALIAWAAKQGSLEKMVEKQTSAMNIGTEAHLLIEHHLKGATEEEMAVLIASLAHPKEAMRAFQNFQAWAKQADFKIVHSEFVCYSKKHKFAGTADGIAYVNGKLSIIDWKTSSGVWDEYWLQTEAYLRAVEEMVEDGLMKLPGPIDNRVILRLPKLEAGFHPVEEPKNIRDFMYFLYAADLWNGMNDMKSRYDKHRKHYAKN